MSGIITIPRRWFINWYMKIFHPNFQEETIRGILSKNDPNFKNLSEEKQRELIAERIKKSGKARWAVL